MASQPLLRLRNIGKDYPLMSTNGPPLGTVWALLRGTRLPRHFRALHGVDLDVVAGASLGLIGENGAGKSTLLKIIAGVVKPSEGTIEIHGRVGALLELGAGFHPDYSGRENVFLAMALMGLGRREAEERLDDILAFADIGEHIEQPIKHYSSGMVVRLGFAVATAIRPDLLLTDEVLAVGDESFQKKCMRWMEAYLSNGGTLVICSHSMFHIQKLCRDAIWIHHGRVRAAGLAAEVARQYLTYHDEKSRLERLSIPARPVAGVSQVRSLELGGDVREAAGGQYLPFGESLEVRGAIDAPDGLPPTVAVGIVRADETAVYGLTNDMESVPLERVSGNSFGFRLRFPCLPLLPGRYRVQAHAMDPEGMRVYDCVEVTFDITGDTRELGTCRLEHEWLFHDDKIV